MPGFRVAIVTGAARGIGAAIARRLGEDGLRIAVCDVQGAEDVATRIAAAGGTAAGFEVDVTDEGAVAELVASVTDRLGAPAVLVNNAGVISASPFLELSLDEWDRVVRVNLTGQFLCARAVLPGMLEQGWGRIVNIASDAAKTAEPHIAHYCASKFGVLGLTQSLALEFARSGVTVNAICPAITDTPMMAELARELVAANPGSSVEDWRAAFVAELPIGRAIRPEEIAGVCAFLVSEGAGAITGEALNVSGGHEMH
jgi:NAD(P)-dependent dehydrogenase (short-subunit alcohol dehydrogenase family)